MLEEMPLDGAVHDRSAFDCGVPVLNEYLQRYADQHRKRGLTSVFVLVDSDEPASILGYYTLSAAEVDAGRFPPAEGKRLPRYPVPCFRLGRLAASRQKRGQGIGRLLVAAAVDRCLKVRDHVAAHALLVDAKDDEARSFYAHYGFRAFADDPLVLYLPLGKMGGRP